ncbi:peptidoglycan editing factor PgeF [Psychrobium sp. MM17-31]|uniref:peptidoglycan editing factor PgeF n=1 Tax=Psychrobium sp. MM17-31 TaxID=2917758 RepID=UPI001EF7454F|nr:peptidoglycan editing factor PgeF [Psychrobium sp. MM17-31]MCG7530600.1 peptidoglycan editing factor PgeF [Psychrobium sp. MM17-31]
MIIPNWAAPSHIKAFTTLRTGGVSEAPFDTNNLGAHVGDDIAAVSANRQAINQYLPHDIIWLNQTHSIDVVDINPDTPQSCDGDAAFTRLTNTPCCVMTADCLPLLVTNRAGSKVAAIHGGWRGLADGIVENSLNYFSESPSELMVWLGPAIGPEQFEVGQDVVDIFVSKHPDNHQCFKARGDKFLADIYQLARNTLNRCGVTQISGGDYCTVTQDDKFFSYRRDGQTGRMATVIWIED